MSEVVINPVSWNGSRVLVVGLARSGRAACLWLASQGAKVWGTDRQSEVEGQDSLQAVGVQLALGGDSLALLEQVDHVVLSPGVPETSPMVRRARELGLPIIGELAMAAEASTSTPMMAITGTNGKSTTTALCAHLLRVAGFRVFLGGNIGLPLTEMLLDGAPVDWAVVEVSSFQLEHLGETRGLAPRVGVWLNLTPDHLDRHGSMEVYGDLKLRMFAGQGPKDAAVCFVDDEAVASRMRDRGLQSRLLPLSRREDKLNEVGVWIHGRQIKHLESGRTFELRAARLAGEHNAENAAAAVAAVMKAGASPEAVQTGLDSFEGLPHRLEPVRELDGVRYINDSKGTNPEATAKSLTSFDVPVVLIGGGQGKGSDYRGLRRVVQERVAHLLLLGADASRMAADLEGCAEIHPVTDMAEAVAMGRRLAQAGQVVLLSPACASFDMFDDYEHRGRVFADLVRELEA